MEDTPTRLAIEARGRYVRDPVFHAKVEVAVAVPETDPRDHLFGLDTGVHERRIARHAAAIALLVDERSLHVPEPVPVVARVSRGSSVR